VSRPTNSKKLLDSAWGGVAESNKNPPLLRLQGHDAKRSGPLEIIAELGGVQRNVIIDTGAEVNVIARDFVWQNSWKKNIKEQKEEILGIANQVIETDGILVLDISIKGATVPVKFLVVPVTNIFAILGIEFIKAHDVELKFKGNDSYMKWRPSKKDKLRQVPLLINTQAPHLGVWKKFNSTEPTQQNGFKTQTLTTKKTGKKQGNYSSKSTSTSDSGSDSYDLSQAYPQISS